MKGVEVDLDDFYADEPNVAPSWGHHQTLYDVYQNYANIAEYVEESTGISSAYFQFMRDGVTYNFIDPEFGPLAMGSIEDPIPIFDAYADNERS